MTIIEAKSLSKSYGKSRGIENLDLEVHEGEVFGFIGPNGAGKSTTIRALMGMIRPTGGTVRINGLDPIRDGKRLRADVGYVPSEVGYYEKMSVAELVKYVSGFHERECSRRIEEMVDRLEIDTSKNLTDLSTGNRKKVAIVLATMHSPKLLILDEPTSSLDPIAQGVLFEILEEENDSGTTVFFSSHVPPYVRIVVTSS